MSQIPTYENFAITSGADQSGNPVLTAHGDIDALEVPRFKDSIDEAAARKSAYVILNLSRVGLFNSGAMQAVREANTQLSQSGQELVVEDPSPAVTKIIGLTESGDELMFSLTDA